MKIRHLVPFLSLCAFLPIRAVVAQDSSDDWKAGAVVYKLRESSGNLGEFTLTTRVTVSAGAMVASSSAKSDWLSAADKTHDIHVLAQTDGIAVSDIDPKNLPVNKDKRGNPVFWQVQVNAVRRGAVKHTTTRDGKDMGSAETDAFPLSYPTEALANQAVDQIRALVQQAQVPRK